MRRCVSLWLMAKKTLKIGATDKGPYRCATRTDAGNQRLFQSSCLVKHIKIPSYFPGRKAREKVGRMACSLETYISMHRPRLSNRCVCLLQCRTLCTRGAGHLTRNHNILLPRTFPRPAPYCSRLHAFV